MPKPVERARSLSQLSTASSPKGLASMQPGGKNKPAMSLNSKGMTLDTGNASLSMSAGKLSIKSGNTQFDLKSLADGIHMQAKDSSSKKFSSFRMNAKGTEEIHKSPTSFSRTQTKTQAFAERAQSASDSLWNAGRKASALYHNFGDIFSDARRSKHSE